MPLLVPRDLTPSLWRLPDLDFSSMPFSSPPAFKSVFGWAADFGLGAAGSSTGMLALGVALSRLIDFRSSFGMKTAGPFFPSLLGSGAPKSGLIFCGAEDAEGAEGPSLASDTRLHEESLLGLLTFFQDDNTLGCDFGSEAFLGGSEFGLRDPSLGLTGAGGGGTISLRLPRSSAPSAADSLRSASWALIRLNFSL